MAGSSGILSSARQMQADGLSESPAPASGLARAAPSDKGQVRSQSEERCRSAQLCLSVWP